LSNVRADGLIDAEVQLRPARRRRLHDVSPSRAAAAYVEHQTTKAAAAALGVPQLTLTKALAGSDVKIKNKGRRRVEWPEQRVRDTLARYLDEHGTSRFPTQAEFRANGGSQLLKAVARTGGATRWAQEFALPLARPGRRAMTTV
jgi:hypothetical protein